MSAYTFQAEDGSLIEREFCAAELPDVIALGGRAYRPLTGASPGQALPGAIVRDARHVAYSLPRLWQEPDLAKVWGKFDDRGHIVCEGTRDKDELQARLADQPGYRSGFTYDP